MLSTTKVLGASELKHQLQVPPDQKWILLHRLFFVCGLTLKWIQHEEPSHLDKSRWQWQAARWTTSPTTWLCSAKSWTTCSGPLSLFSDGAFVRPVLQADLGKESKTKCWGGSRNKSRERERRKKSWRRSTLRFVVWSSLAISFLNMVQDMAGRGERRCASTLQVPQTSTHLRVRNFLCRATSSVELSCHEDKRFLFATLSPHRLVTRGSEIFGDFWVTK